MARKWKVLEVLQQGSLQGKTAGQVIKLAVQFPWGTEVRHFAPTMTDEDIKLTLDSFVEQYEQADRAPVSPSGLND